MNQVAGVLPAQCFIHVHIYLL